MSKLDIREIAEKAIADYILNQRKIKKGEFLYRELNDVDMSLAVHQALQEYEQRREPRYST